MSALDSAGRAIWIADANRGDGKRFIMRTDEKLTAFLELESVIWGSRRSVHVEQQRLRRPRLSEILSATIETR